ncbi:MAG: phosphate ABC transporter substrate-binding protein PstS [Pseudomonadota bacterium]
MKIIKIISAILLISFYSTTIAKPNPTSAITINGEGSTVIYALMSYWTHEYKTHVPQVKINHVGSGSGIGIKMLRDKTVDFAASEMPIDKKILDQNGWTEFPIAISPLEIIYNLPKISGNKLILDGSVIADIYMGKITYWDDPAIKRLNPKLTLPHHMIKIIYRSNESGTNYTFSKWLEKVSPDWAIKHDGNLLLNYLAKNKIGVNSSDALAKVVKGLSYSIGYCDYNAAEAQNLSMASLITEADNEDAKYLVRPGLLSAYAGLVNVSSSNFESSNLDLISLPGSNSWPVMMATYVIIPTKQEKSNLAKLNQMLKFFLWTLKRGGSYASDLKYIPIPDKFTKDVIQSWEKSIPGIDFDKLILNVNQMNAYS